MEIRGCTELTVKKDDRIYSLHAPQGAQYPELHCVILELLAHTTEKLNEISQKAQAMAPKIVSADEVKIDE